MNSSENEARLHASAVDFNDLVRWLWLGRWWIIAASVSVAVLAGIAAFLMTPIYRATVVLMPTSEENVGLGQAIGNSLGSLGGLAALAGVSIGGADSHTEEALAVLRSRQFADSFIRDKDLIPVFFYKKWDVQARRWIGPEGSAPTNGDAVKYFDRQVRSVFEDNKLGTITLQIDWRDRQVAAEWANELVARLNAEMQRRAIAETDASLGFLKKELAETTIVETRLAINRLIESQINQRMLANVTAEYAFRVIDPAVPPDKGDVERPRRLIMVLIGAFLGFLMGVTAVVMFRR